MRVRLSFNRRAAEFLAPPRNKLVERQTAALFSTSKLNLAAAVRISGAPSSTILERLMNGNAVAATNGP